MKFFSMTDKLSEQVFLASRQALLMLICCLYQTAWALSPVALDSQITVKYSGLVYNRSTKTYDNLATLTNTSANTISGPICLIVNSLSDSSVTSANASGNFSAPGTAVDGKPYLAIPLANNTLPPGQSVSNFLIKFNDPNKVVFSFKASVMTGPWDNTNGKQVTLQVSAADRFVAGRTLHYKWHVTEGNISKDDSPTAIWTLPDGPGSHFANVEVSNSFGGYSLARIKVSTDNLGTTFVQPAPQTFTQPDWVTNKERSYQTRTSFYFIANNTATRDVYLANVGLKDIAPFKGYLEYWDGPETINTGSSGRFTITDAGLCDYFLCRIGSSAINDMYAVHFWGSGTLYIQGPYGDTFKNPDFGSNRFFDLSSNLVGSVRLEDGSLCGSDSFLAKNGAYLGNPIGAQVTYSDALGNETSSPYAPYQPVSGEFNQFGDFAIPDNGPSGYIKISCEGNPPKVVAVADLPKEITFERTGKPLISTIIASINGQQLADAKFLPVADRLISGVSSFQSVDRADHFLSYKGSDDSKSACAYYYAIGAAEACTVTNRGPGGVVKDLFYSPTGKVMTFDDWKRKVGIGPYVRSGAKEHTATYVNKIDLNLVRNHHAINYGSSKAAYVCNHEGPKSEQESDVNAAIENAINGKNLVACVAMDYGYEGIIDHYDNWDYFTGRPLNPPKPVTYPYVRYYTFAPNGQLLTSVNLDGRGEKYMPGACVACHGGDKYADKYRVTNGGGVSPDFGGHALPFDTNNFLFHSSLPGYRQKDQDEEIYNLNGIVYSMNMTDKGRSLIVNWYNQRPTEGVPSYNGQYGNIENVSQYTGAEYVVAQYCRTCHVALPQADLTGYVKSNLVCGGSHELYQNHAMPNSLVTFLKMKSDTKAQQYLGANCLFNGDPLMNKKIYP